MSPIQLSALNSGYAGSACQYCGHNVVKRQSLVQFRPSGGGWQDLRKHSLPQADIVPVVIGRYGQRHLTSETSAGSVSWSAPSWSAWPRSSSLERSTNLVCKVAVEPGASDEKLAKTFDVSSDGSILTGDGSELQRTLRLVECAMLAATAGLAFFLSNLFRLEISYYVIVNVLSMIALAFFGTMGYLGCFFPLPVVISSMRWGASAGRRTMVATALLLLVLSGPVKSASYLLMHGLVGLAIGSLWRWNVNWFGSLVVCTAVRCFGSLGFVLLSSWLLKENLLHLITINAHASISYMLAALGINIVPTMLMIYFIFGGLLFLNCGSFVFLLHVLYVIFLKRLGIEYKVAVPGWIARAV